MIVIMEGLFPVNHALDVPKLLHVARDGDSPLLIKPVLLLSLLEELHEQWVVEVNHRHHKSLLLLTLPHLDCQTPFWHVSDLLLLPVLLLLMKMRQVQVEVQQTFLATAHICKSEHQARHRNLLFFLIKFY